MPDFHYETLSPTDYAFLVGETPELHMHVTGVMMFKAGPLKRRGGGIDFEAIKKAYGDVLFQIPRYRQKLMWQRSDEDSNSLNWMRWRQSDESKPPVWVDDDHFNLDYHMRHTALPKPGNEAQLQKLVARIASQQLDRTRPLWEIWVVEGLRGGDRFAVISKMHHCMVDGKSGIDLAHIIMHTDPEYRPPEPPPYQPRPAPSEKELHRESRKEQFLAPWKIVGDVTEWWRASDDVSDDLRSRAKAIGETFSSNYGKSMSPTPINGENGPHRAVVWLDTPLTYIKQLRQSFGCTVNDVVLTIVTGAFREFLRKKGYDVSQGSFNIAAPVSIWGERDRGEVGNQIMTWDIELPIHLQAPIDQLAAIKANTDALKESNQAQGVKMITSFLRYTPGLMSLAAQGAMGPAYNSFVTNVPGPQFPVYQLGAELLRTYPVVPLLSQMGMGIGVMSYNGVVSWGVTADIDVVEDAPEFIKCLSRSLSKVGKAAGCGKVPKVDRCLHCDGRRHF